MADESKVRGVSESVDILTGLVDFNGFFKGADTLRLKMDMMKTTGTATFYSSSSNFCLQNGCKVSRQFDSKYVNIEALNVGEGGVYHGFSYSSYDMPATLGLQTSNEALHGVAFDEDYEQKKYMWVIGLDAASYASRYHLDYGSLYLLPRIGFGIAQHHFSGKAVEEALNGDKREITGEYALALTYALDLGYIYQRRWGAAKGLGYSVQGGLRAKYEMAKFVDYDHEDLEVAFSGSDIMWGPYLQLNVMF